MVRTNSTNKAFVDERVVRGCPRPEENTLQYLMPVFSSIEGSMEGAHEVLGTSGSGSYH